MRDLYEIEVSVMLGDAEDVHAWIELCAATSSAAGPQRSVFGDPGVQDIVDAARYSAGILARVGLLAARDLEWTRIEHGCRPVNRGTYLDDFCHASISPKVMSEPESDIGDPPAVELYVPRGQVDDWLQRVEGWLRTIQASEQWTWRPELTTCEDPA